MSGGDVAQAWPWERMADSNAPSHDLLVALLDPQPGERWLDLGTGSGGVALRAAWHGADSVGVDISPEAVEQARAAGAEEALDVRFEVADAQALPFADASFDVVVSAFGVNFVADHARAAGELVRVTVPGGRLGLTLMPADSRAGALWTLLRRFGADGGDHPASWSQRVDELLGEAFELETRRVDAPAGDEPPPEEAWAFFRDSFGPLRDLLARLDPAAAAELRDEFIALRSRFAGKPRSYLLVLGRRR